MFAIRIWTLQYRSGLQPLLFEIRAAAFGALFHDRFSPGDELTLRIAIASVKCLTFSRSCFDDFALGALRTLHPDGLLLHKFAGGIVAAGGKLAVPPRLEHQLVAALR